MTPCEVLATVRGLGYRLGLRPGGLRLTGTGEPSPEVLGLIREHREDLLAFLEVDEKAWAAFEASCKAGRTVPFSRRLLSFVHPSLRAIAEAEGEPESEQRKPR